MAGSIAAASPPILARLKAETAARHDALERRLDVFGRLDTLDAYRALLGRFLGFYEPIEERIRLVERHGRLPLSLDERWKTERLKRDLATLGCSAGGIAALPRSADLPPLATAADAFGCLYVLEGATLGGQVIARLLTRHFGLGPDSGGAFFASYGRRVGPMWRELGVALASYTDQAGAHDAVVRSAHATFAAFERWMAPGGHTGKV